MRDLPERALTALAWTAAGLTLAALATLLGAVALRGAPTLGLELIFADTPPLDALRGAPVFDGLWPACLGTVALVLLASALAVPLGVAGGVYLAEFAPPRARNTLSLGVELLAGVPSILMGLFGFALILLMRRTLAPQATTGLLLSAGCLGLLVLPYVMAATSGALRALPGSLRLTGAALGLTRGQTTARILLPQAAPGIMSGVILAVGRAAEDTAVILLTGVVANAGAPRSLLDKFEALPFTIYTLAADHRTAADLDRAFGAALVLLALTVGLHLAARRLHATLERRWTT